MLSSSTSGHHALVFPKHKTSRSNPTPGPPPTKVPLPPTISHFVMNLPGSATCFLHHFKGLYHGRKDLFVPRTETKLPMVHVHCFAAKNAGMHTATFQGGMLTEDEILDEILARVEGEIGVKFRVGDAEKEGEAEVLDVRDVAPNKRMFCVSFRVPPEVAFVPRE